MRAEPRSAWGLEHLTGEEAANDLVWRRLYEARFLQGGELVRLWLP